MPNDDRMTIDERLKYLGIRQRSYQKASRKEKGEGSSVRLSFDWTGAGKGMMIHQPHML